MSSEEEAREAPRHPFPSTWIKVKRLEMFRFSVALGNETMKSAKRWRSFEEPRLVKESTEYLSRKFSGPQIGNIKQGLDDLNEAVAILVDISDNPFFEQNVAHREYEDSNRKRMKFVDKLFDLVNDINLVYSNPDYFSQPSDGIKNIVPNQRIGPLQFRFVDGILKVNHLAASPDDADRANVESAFNVVARMATQILENIVGSNIDHRLEKIIKEMHETILQKQDIIYLAITNITLQVTLETCEEEIIPSLFAELRSFSIAIGMYVSQFPQWTRFAENVVISEYGVEDIQNIYRIGQGLVRDLRNASDIVDEEVPRTIRWMLDAIQNPRKSAKRSVFSAIRTIENLISEIMIAFSDVIDSARSGVNHGIKKVAFYGSASAVLLIAADCALQLSPTAQKLTQTPWLGQVAEIVIKNMRPVE